MEKAKISKNIYIKMNSNSFDSEGNSYETKGEEAEYENKKHEEQEEKEEHAEQEEKPLTNLDLIKSISTTLTMILEENKNLKHYKEIIHKQKKMIFSSTTVPNISIYDYLIRIQTYSNIEKNTLIISLIYIDRLCELGHLTLTYYNIHRIIFSSILMAIKYNEDCFYDNKYYSEIAGVKLKELNIMENIFFEMCQFKFYVSFEIFEKYSQYLNSFEKNK